MTQKNENGNPLPESSVSQVLNILGADVEYSPGNPVMIQADISWDKARDLLAFNTQNRNMSKLQVDGLRRQIEKGSYTYGITPIVFDEEGILADGQHRLEALRLSKAKDIPQWFLVGVPQDARFNIDTGKKRSVADALKMMGVDGGQYLNAIYGGALIGQRLHIPNKKAWLSACCPHDYRTIATSKEILEVYEKHKKGFDFVLEIFHNAIVYRGSMPFRPNNSVLNGVFLRAFYYEDEQKLRDFVRLLYDPLLSTEDVQSVGVKAMNIVTDFREKTKTMNRKRSYSRDITMVFYSLTETAVRNFCRTHGSIDSGEKVSLRLTQSELYPVSDFDRRPAKEKEFILPSKKPKIISRMIRQANASAILENTIDDDEEQDNEID